MRSPGTNGEGELRGQPGNRGSRGKMAVKMECVHCAHDLFANIPGFTLTHSADTHSHTHTIV